MDRIYADKRGDATKFHQLIKQNVQKKKFKPIVTTEFDAKEFQDHISNQIKKQKDILKDTKTEKLPELEDKMKKALLTKKFESKSKKPISDSLAETQEMFNFEKRQLNLGQDVDSISGFKLVNPLPPSTGERVKGVPSNIMRYKIFNKDEINSDLMKSTNAFTGYKEEDIKIKPTATIINLNSDSKGVTYLIENKFNQSNKFNKDYNITTEKLNLTSGMEIISEENKTEEKKEEVVSDEYQYMNSINNFIKEAFEGKDYRINFVYYLPSNKENYYELRLTEFSKIAKEKIYYTLSAKGLTVYEDKQPKEFIKLSEWIIEREGYNYVANINFFKNFKIWRIIKKWRQNIFKQKKIAYQNDLASKLMFDNENYNNRLLEHKTNCNNILKRNILNLNVGYESNTFEEFKKRQEDEREILKKNLQKVHNESELIFVEGVKKIFSDLHKKITIQNNDSNFSDNKKNKPGANNDKNEKQENKENNNNENAIVNEDSIVGFENFNFKYKMMIKTEVMNFIKLAFLFDYILLDCLRKMYLTSMQNSIEKLQDYNSKEEPTHLKENILTKRDEYVKPIPNLKHGERVIPYFLINTKLKELDREKIEVIHIIKEKIKLFFFKFSSDDEFKPAAHIEILDEDKESVPSNITSLDYEYLANPNYYFTEYYPDKADIKTEFSNQIYASIESLKVQCWKGHPEFKKYLPYLGDYDDRFGDWDNDEKVILDPSAILCTDDLFQDRDTIISHEIDIAFKKCDNYMKLLNELFNIHWDTISLDREILLHENIKEADEIFRLIFHITEKNIKHLQRLTPFEDDIGLVKLNHENGLRKDIILYQENLLKFIKNQVPDLIKSRLKLIEKWLNEMHKKVKGKIDNPKDYLNKNAAKDELDKHFFNYERKINIIDSIMSLFKKKNFENITTEDMSYLNDVNNSKFRLKIAWDDMNEVLTKSRGILKDEIETKDIPLLLQKSNDIEALIDNSNFIKFTTDKANILNLIDELQSHEKKTKELLESANTYNDFFAILFEAPHTFDDLKRTGKKITILIDLWKSLMEFDEQAEKEKSKTLREVNPEELLGKIKSYKDIGMRAKNTFIRDTEGKDYKGSAIEELLTKVIQFEESMQVVKDLSSKDLQKEYNPTIPKEMIGSYCDRINKLFTKEFLDSIGYKGENLQDLQLQKGTLELQQLLNIGADKQQQTINRIVIEAKECNHLFLKWTDEIKKDIIGISVEWTDSPFKDYVQLLNEDILIAKVEELQSSLNHIFSNKYFKSLMKKTIDDMRINKEHMDVFLDTIEEWRTFQKKFFYIVSIITSNADFNKKLSDSGFEILEKDFKSFLLTVKATNNTIPKMNDKKFRTRYNLKEFNKSLEQVQLKIELHLIELRNIFPRFYFISNDDLLFMLSNCKPENYHIIKPYFLKFFDDINDLKFKEIGRSCCGIIGTSGEEFMFVRPHKLKGEKVVELGEAEKNKGGEKTIQISEKLEDWLRTLESIMTEMVKANLTAIDDLNIVSFQFDKDVNLKNLTSQVIAVWSHVCFTIKTEMAINEFASEKDRLQEHYELVQKEIKIFASKVNKKDITENIRRTISNYITHYVHFREICREIGGEDDITVNSFNWQKVLRAYFKDENVVIQQLNASFIYGYEYNGPSTRLVISGLTDRVWLTITSSLSIKAGCSLGGPAGTGKTETTKDLAKFLGFQCIVFNCSEQVTFKTLGNIFSGLCMHRYGVFACLDEFNRISVEVLSVTAQFLLNIKLGLIELEKNSSNKEYVQKIKILTEIDLNGKLGVFVTMNPTYSGRTELPDNLKSLFRPISMMVPDFETISEVKLYSEGYTTAKGLAKKLTKLYDLAGKQLSQQDHYDFTLRTVGSVLAIAGILKRESRDSRDAEDEIKLEEGMLIKALKDANLPKFLEEDKLLFKALLSDLFPDSNPPDIFPEEFMSMIDFYINYNKLESSPFHVDKCLQFFNIISIRFGVCLVGPAGTGKSTVLKLVSEAMTALNTRDKTNDKYKEVQSLTINPKSISMGELYGQENEETKTFVYGIATNNIKEGLVVPDPTDKLRLTVFDGPIDTIWIENLNSVLDDSMLLCLSNGERIKLMRHLRLIFEVEDLSQASLATVSRLGIVYVGRSDDQWKVIYKSWLKNYFKDESILTIEMVKYLDMLFADKMTDALSNIQDLGEYIYISPIFVQCVQTTCTFLEMYFTNEYGFIGIDTPGIYGESMNPDLVNRLRKKIVYVFGLCLAWGVFACVSGKASHKVEAIIKNKFNEIKVENNVILMEHKYNPDKIDLIEKYKFDENSFEYTQGMSFWNIFIPTLDSVRYSAIIESLLKVGKHVFITGDTGVGKTAIINSIIKNMVGTEEYTKKIMNFSATTSSEKTQESLEDGLEKIKGKSVLGGQNGKKLIIFIDDINMPEPTKHGSHPPIELLRQLIDNKYYFDRPKFFKKHIEDYVMIACGGRPIGGRSKLTDRFNRQFAVVNFPQPNKIILLGIYETILRSFFLKIDS